MRPGGRKHKRGEKLMDTVKLGKLVIWGIALLAALVIIGVAALYFLT